jgi:hypothetical protein
MVGDMTLLVGEHLRLPGAAPFCILNRTYKPQIFSGYGPERIGADVLRTVRYLFWSCTIHVNGYEICL